MNPTCCLCVLLKWKIITTIHVNLTDSLKTDLQNILYNKKTFVSQIPLVQMIISDVSVLLQRDIQVYRVLQIVTGYTFNYHYYYFLVILFGTHFFCSANILCK